LFVLDHEERFPSRLLRGLSTICTSRRRDGPINSDTDRDLASFPASGRGSCSVISQTTPAAAVSMRALPPSPLALRSISDLRGGQAANASCVAILQSSETADVLPANPLCRLDQRQRMRNSSRPTLRRSSDAK
jgi:hypothetical protein